jgi:YHS domain-containing protein
MNTTIRKAAKACLVTAASGLLCGQVAALLAQEGNGAIAQPSTGAQVLQAQGYVPSTRATTTADGSEPETPLQRELRKQYQQGKRDMPSFQLDNAPHTEGVVPSNADAAYDATQAPAAAPGAKAPAPKPNWFERTFHVGRGKRKPAPVAESDAPPAKRNWFGRASAPAKSATPDSRSAFAAAPAKQVPAGSAPRLSAPPVTAGPAAQPALSQLREPAPLAPAPTARELTVNKVPKVASPSTPNVESQTMLDESGMSDDGESLDLVETQPQAAAQAPQEVADRSDDASEEESPYSGVKISPNEAERNALAAPTPDMADDDSEDEFATPTNPPAPAVLKSAPSAPRIGIRPMEDDDMDDEDDDDDDALSSAKSKPRTLAEAPVQKAAHLLEKSSTRSAATQVSGTISPAPFEGMEGMCPVALKDNRKLIEAQPTIVSTYKGKTFAFSTPEAKRTFDQNPKKYAPVGSGADVVKLASGKKGVDGNLEHAAWFRGRLYLFSSAETRLEFVDEPTKFVIED